MESTRDGQTLFVASKNILISRQLLKDMREKCLGKITRHNKNVTYAIRLEKVEHGFISLNKIEKGAVLY